MYTRFRALPEMLRMPRVQASALSAFQALFKSLPRGNLRAPRAYQCKASPIKILQSEQRLKNHLSHTPASLWVPL